MTKITQLLDRTTEQYGTGARNSLWWELLSYENSSFFSIFVEKYLTKRDAVAAAAPADAGVITQRSGTVTV